MWLTEIGEHNWREPSTTEPERVLLTGSRDWIDGVTPNLMPKDRDEASECGLITGTVQALLSRFAAGSVVIEGEAPGLDSVAAAMAKRVGLSVLRYPADWKRYHAAAGPIRNAQMLDEGRPTLVYAFYRHRESRGTANMVKQACEAGLPVKEFLYDDKASGGGDTREAGGAGPAAG